MKVRKVLSIDFDYFLEGPKEAMDYILHCGNERKNPLDLRYHAIRQVVEHPEILDIKISKDKIRLIEQCLFDQNSNIRALIGESHAEMVQMMNWDKDYVFDITNLDNHHDIAYTDAKKLESEFRNDKYGCANWVSYFQHKNKLLHYTWVNTEHSREFDTNININMKTTQDIGIIDNECFNTIFLCKSSTWIPAFLDHEFDRLMDFIIAMFKQTVIVNDTRIFNRIQQFNLSHEYLSELVKRSE